MSVMYSTQKREGVCLKRAIERVKGKEKEEKYDTFERNLKGK